jgi:hypothetical protein
VFRSADDPLLQWWDVGLTAWGERQARLVAPLHRCKAVGWYGLESSCCVVPDPGFVLGCGGTRCFWLGWLSDLAASIAGCLWPF